MDFLAIFGHLFLFFFFLAVMVNFKDHVVSLFSFFHAFFQQCI